MCESNNNLDDDSKGHNEEDRAQQRPGDLSQKPARL